MSSVPAARFSVEEYLAKDRDAELKSEYHDGELFPICAVSVEHGQLAINVGHCLRSRIQGPNCRIVASPVRVRVSPSKFVYPDIFIVGGKAQLTDEHRDTITNPKVIVEILSPPTADYDRGGKFELYRELPSFEEYILIEQDQYRVETRLRQADGNWLLRRFDGLQAVLPIQSLNFSIPLSEIYSDVL